VSWRLWQKCNNLIIFSEVATDVEQYVGNPINSFILIKKLTSGANVIKLFTAVSYDFNKIEQGILNYCTVDLLYDWFGLVYFSNKNKNCHLSYS
jgi:hypothetical protein